MAYIYYFPFLVGDLVSYDEVWNFYLTLRKIIKIEVAPAIHKEYAGFLNKLILEHHEINTRLFNDTLKPKHHKKLHHGPASVVENISCIKDSCEISKIQLPSEFTSACLEVQWVNYKGTRYKIGINIGIEFDDSCGLPLFGQIDKKFCNENRKICFLYHEQYTVGFDKNLHTYEVTSTGKAKSILIDNLLLPRPVIFHILNTKSYIKNTV